MLQHLAPICFDLGLPREDLSHAIHFAAKKENPWGVMEKESEKGMDTLGNPAASQQVIFQEDPVLWGLDMGLFSRQIHSNAARNKMVNPPNPRRRE
jgi:hypothetical protein